MNKSPRKRIDTKMLLASMGISFGLVLFIMGARVGLTGKDASNLPDAIEGISPGDNERVLRQSQVIVDFVDGYEATLYIDGIEMPTTAWTSSSRQAPLPHLARRSTSPRRRSTTRATSRSASSRKKVQRSPN
ncbi:MAG: hypothetical protein EBQ75_05400 [Actinobacteria bacterium]|nr:hypothetical protein [Actinomycetota bacterium]